MSDSAFGSSVLVVCINTAEAEALFGGDAGVLKLVFGKSAIIGMIV
jgi:hypothetical protein